MVISVGINNDKNIIKLENPCTGTFLLLNKDEAHKLSKDLNNLLEMMG
jgi:hypothetical protein